MSDLSRRGDLGQALPPHLLELRAQNDHTAFTVTRPATLEAKPLKGASTIAVSFTVNIVLALGLALTRRIALLDFPPFVCQDEEAEPAVARVTVLCGCCCCGLGFELGMLSKVAPVCARFVFRFFSLIWVGF